MISSSGPMLYPEHLSVTCRIMQVGQTHFRLHWASWVTAWSSSGRMSSQLEATLGTCLWASATRCEAQCTFFCLHMSHVVLARPDAYCTCRFVTVYCSLHSICAFCISSSRSFCLRILLSITSVSSILPAAYCMHPMSKVNNQTCSHWRAVKCVRQCACSVPPVYLS